MVLTFHTNGTVTALWDDLISLQELGKVTTTRASTIEFNDDLQKWEVRAANENRTLLYVSPSYQRCRDWEKEYFDL